MASAPGLIFCYNEDIGSHFHVLRVRTHFRLYEGIGSRFKFCAPGLIFDITEVVGSHFLVLRSRTRFRRYRGRRVMFSSFARPESFLAVRKIFISKG
jgi:hypothetical protein